MALQHYLFTKVELSLLDTFDMHSIPNGEKQARRQVVPHVVVLQMEAFGDTPRGSKITTQLVAITDSDALNAAKTRSDQEAVADKSKSLEEIMSRMMQQNLDEHLATTEATTKHLLLGPLESWIENCSIQF